MSDLCRDPATVLRERFERRLGQTLVSEGRVTRTGLAAALEHQLLHGGHLATALFELGAVDGAALTEVSARLLGIAAVDPRVVAAGPRDVRARLPLAFVRRRRIVPFALEGRTLLVATAEPWDMAALEEASQLAGHRVQARLLGEVPLVRLLNHLYGVPMLPRFEVMNLSRRSRIRAGAAEPGGAPGPEGGLSEQAFERMLAQAEAPTEARPSAPPTAPAREPAPERAVEPAPGPAPEPSDDGRPPAADLEARLRRAAAEVQSAGPSPAEPEEPPIDLDPEELEPLDEVPPEALDEEGDVPDDTDVTEEEWRMLVEAAGVPAPAAPAPAPALHPPPTPPPEPPAVPPLAPLHDLSEAVRLLGEAADRRDLGEILCRFCLSRGARAALLVHHGGGWTGWTGAGRGVDPDAVAALALPSSAGSMFGLVSRTGSHLLGPLTPHPLHDRFVAALGGGAPRSAGFFPVHFRGRVVFGVYLDAGADAWTSPDVAEVLLLAQRVAGALEGLIRRRLQAA